MIKYHTALKREMKEKLVRVVALKKNKKIPVEIR